MKARVLFIAGFSAFTTCPDNLFAGSLECISGNPSAENLTTWQQEAALALQEGTLSDTFVAERIRECFGPSVPSCIAPTLEYATRHDTASSSDDPIAAETPEKRPPAEFLAPGSDGLAYVLPADIIEVAAARGWPLVKYKSRHSGGFDSQTASLMMVLVRGETLNPPVDYDQWLNFSLPQDQGEHALTPLPQADIPSASDYEAEGNGGPSLPRVFTIVTLKHPQANKPAQVFFQMFRRGLAGDPIFRPDSSTSVSSCISCHPNGLRAISPLGYHVREGEAQLPEEAWNIVSEINEAMDEAADFSAVSWRSIKDPQTGKEKPLIKPDAHGPIVGQKKPLNGQTRTEAFILGGSLPDGSSVQGCFDDRKTISLKDIFNRPPGAKNVFKLSENPDVDWKKISRAMRCAKCHDGDSRGVLNDLTSWAQIDFKILVDQSMPLGYHSNPIDNGGPNEPVTDKLTSDERIALANCLKAEFDRERRYLAKWLTKKSCGN